MWIKKRGKGRDTNGNSLSMAFLFDLKVTRSTGQCLVQLLSFGARRLTPALTNVPCGIAEALLNAAGLNFLCLISDPVI